MGKVLIIGAGGVATVAAHKVCQNTDVFTEVMIASRTKKKCDALADVLNKKYGTNVQTAQVDADSVEQLVELLGVQTRHRDEPGLAISGSYHHGSLSADRLQLS